MAQHRKNKSTAHHEHRHGHEHVQNYNAAFIISIVANGLFVVFQIIFAIWANSTSLLADAFHNLGDVLSLVLAWVATVLMKRLPTASATYGMKKTSILAALANGVLLVFTCGIIATEAMYKFFSPESIHALSVMIVAGIGIVINGATAALFMHGSEDLNIRGAFLHLFYDALISAGVVVSAFLMYLTGWLWLDPAVALIIAFVIIKGTWALFTDSLRLIVDAVPRSVSLEAVRDQLLAVSGVEGLHDLHIWALSTMENALSVHLYMPEVPLTGEARNELIQQLKLHHDIHHITLQVEQDQRLCSEYCNTH
ncbi:cation transporter [Legionella israelensis]|uniref:Cation transporter n=1 Tax=Legionella israelensis TaxID=454 RepID=A0AAX1EJ26_9GAMM|nr:cation diffusion facilitator family transporter [Legionella israelensis]QBR85043.1 cation transporter [Legionella israelensis]